MYELFIEKTFNLSLQTKTFKIINYEKINFHTKLFYF